MAVVGHRKGECLSGHAILLLGIVLGCFCITLDSQASVKGHWVAILIVSLEILI